MDQGNIRREKNIRQSFEEAGKSAARLNSYTRTEFKKIEIIYDEVFENISSNLVFRLDNGTTVLLDFKYIRMLRFMYIHKIIRNWHFKSALGSTGFSQVRGEFRKTLVDLKHEYNSEKNFCFDKLNVRSELKSTERMVGIALTNATSANGLDTKMTLLNNAIQYQLKMYNLLTFLNSSITDIEHFQHKNTVKWLGKTEFSGVGALVAFIKSNQEALCKLTEVTVEKMREASGVPFKVDLKTSVLGFKWYALGETMLRGQDFSKSYRQKERLEKVIRPYTYPQAAAYFAFEKIDKRVDEAWPFENAAPSDVNHLAELFYEIHKLVLESVKWNGILPTAIEWVHPHNPIHSREDAWNWARDNFCGLLMLQTRVFLELKRQEESSPDGILPTHLKKIVEASVVQVPSSAESLEGLDQRLGCLLSRREVATGKLLAACLLRKQLLHYFEKLMDIGQLSFQFDPEGTDEQFPQQFYALYDECKKVQNMLAKVNKCILELYQSAHFGVEPPADELNDKNSDSEIDRITPLRFREIYEVVQEDMHHHLRTLDYTVIYENGFRKRFTQALTQTPAIALSVLERLFQELHDIPIVEDLSANLHVLKGMKPQPDMDETEQQLYENEALLQTLLDEIQDQLRKRLAGPGSHSRKVRLETLSLADYYAGNYESLLQEATQLIEKMTSIEESDRIRGFIEEIEFQLLEAQKNTCEGGAVLGRLDQFEEKKLLPWADLLRKDLVENNTRLNLLLRSVGRIHKQAGLAKIRLGGYADVTYLNTVINFEEREKLHSQFAFVDNISLDQMKQFVAYHRRWKKYFADLFKKALTDRSGVSLRVASLITPRVAKDYLDKEDMGLELKTAILIKYPKILDAEAQLLARACNFIKPEKFPQLKDFKKLVQMMAGSNIEGVDRTEMEEVWRGIDECLKNYAPERHKDIYLNNMDILVSAVLDVLFPN